MPVPFSVAPPATPAVQVPSHLPLQSTLTPPLAVQLPEHLPEQLPVQATSALAEAVHSPLHSTVRVPPVQVGGWALMSHSTLASQDAWQLAVAVSDALHVGALKWAVALPASLPFAPKFKLIRALARAHQALRAFGPVAPTTLGSLASAPKSRAMF